MKTRSASAPLLSLLVVASAYAQTPAPKTEAELAKETALLKAQQLYYDQLALTTKSQQAASDASIAAQTTSITAATALQNAQYANDLSLATALKSSGLSAATGKEGAITIAASEKSMLHCNVAASKRSKSSARAFARKSPRNFPKTQMGTHLKAFVAPATYEQLVQKSIVDISQLTSLHTAAVAGTQSSRQ